MFGLNKVVEAIVAYAEAIDESFRQCGAAGGRATMASAMCASVVREMYALIDIIKKDEGLPDLATGVCFVDADEKKLDTLLGKKFMRRVKEVKDLGSLAVQEIVNAAAAIGSDAREDQAEHKLAGQDNIDVTNAAGLQLLAIHFVSNDIQNHGCALERIFDSVHNQLVGARLARLALRLKTQAESIAKAKAEAAAAVVAVAPADQTSKAKEDKPAT